MGKLDEIKKKSEEFIQETAGDMEGKQLEISGKKFNFLQIGTFVGAVLELISCFFPFAGASASVGSISVSASASYFSSGFNFIVLIVLLLATCVLTLKSEKKFAAGTAALNFIWLIIDSFVLSGALQFGAYIMLIAALIVLATAVMGYVNEKKQK